MFPGAEIDDDAANRRALADALQAAADARQAREMTATAMAMDTDAPVWGRLAVHRTVPGFCSTSDRLLPLIREVQLCVCHCASLQVFTCVEL